MAKKLFVGGLPFDYSNEKLQELFAPVGKVLSAVMVQDLAQGRTRGFGFVAMSTPEESLAAIKALNGTKIGEKTIYVTEAREKKPETAPRSGNTTWDQWKPKDANRKTPGMKTPYRGDSRPREERGGPEAPRKPFGRGPFPYNYQSEGRRPPSSRNKERGPNPYPGKSTRNDSFSRPSSNKPPKKAFWNKFKKNKNQD